MEWPRAKLKHVTRLGYGDALPRDESSDGLFLVYGSNGPFSSFSRANTKGPAIILGRKGSYGKVNWTDEPCFATDTTFFIDSSTTQYNLRWIYWLLHTLQLDEGSEEAAVPGLNRETAYSRDVIVPPFEQQCATADYLDRETAQLDALVLENERVLELLVERRQALTGRAVTRGINPDVSYCTSGVPWLGDIPAHWEIERARWLFKERDERSSTGDEELLTVSHLTGVTPRSEKQVYMFEAETTEGYKICLENDLVINTLWAWMGAMGVAPLNGIVSPSYHVYELAAQRLDPGFVDALVRLPLFAQEVTRYSKGVWSSRLRLYPEGFFEVFLPVPPREEQQEIILFLQKEQRRLEDLNAEAQRAIALLKERRSALIEAAVAGQLKIK